MWISHCIVFFNFLYQKPKNNITIVSVTTSTINNYKWQKNNSVLLKNVEHVPQVPSLMCKAYTEPCHLMCLVKLPIKHELNMLKNTICCIWCEMINKLLPTRMSLDSATNKYTNNAYQTRSGIWHPYKGHLLRTPPFLFHILCIYMVFAFSCRELQI